MLTIRRVVVLLPVLLGLSDVWHPARGETQPPTVASSAGATPLVVAHRGLLKHAPENTLANFRACLELRIGFEVDVRRTKDGTLVCVHDDTVNRTTEGRGAVAELTLDKIKRLDAGSWFSPAFRGERIPTFDEVVSLVENHERDPVLIAIDLKAGGIEADCVRTAKARGVLGRLIFIGTTIDDAQVRRKLRDVDPSAHVACLAQNSENLPAAIADKDSDWAYLRFVPTRDDLDRVHKAGKRAFIAGPTVAGLDRANWRSAMLAGIDGMLTDFPLELADDARAATPDEQFQRLAARFIDESPALSPINATTLGDHRFDSEVDEVSEAARAKERAFCQRFLDELATIDRQKLSRENQVDYALLVKHFRSEMWNLDRFQGWAWNPIAYTQLAGESIYGLMAREFAPVEKRLRHVADRLEKLPRLYEQIRGTLDAQRVPPIHAETAIKQNRGLLSMLDSMVRPQVGTLGEADRQRLVKAMSVATEACEKHQVWLEKELLPNAKGDFRIGPKLYDEKLAFTLGTGLTRQEIRDRADFELNRVRAEMYKIARDVLKADPQREVEAPAEPSPDQQQQVIAAALEKAAADIPPRDGVVAAAQKSLEITTAFIRQRDLVTIPPDPLDIIVMPAFKRGVSVAYCESPGPLEVGQKTFYAVAPPPTEWTDVQVKSFLREYNTRSIHNLTVHEAMPGHFLQLAHANRSPNRLRAMLSSGTFVEGWGVYSEQMMREEGFLDGDPLMKLVTLKWYLRVIANAILDQSVHVDGIRREDAMRLMTQGAFQEEREAAGKWIRAQVTSAQLSTYFVGYQEHRDLRDAARKAWGNQFTLKRYHDGAISFGSPPVRFVKALLLGEVISE